MFKARYLVGATRLLIRPQAGNTPLQVAVSKNDFSVTRILLAYDASVNVTDKVTHLYAIVCV